MAMTAKSSAKHLTYQQQFIKLRDRIKELGSVLWGDECCVNIYQGTHLEVSAGGYVKYEFHGCDTPAKILDGMRTTLEGVTQALKDRRDEINEALEV